MMLEKNVERMEMLHGKNGIKEEYREWTMTISSNFFSGKNVFITDHTGFKGAWFAKILALFGANVTGYALDNIGYKDMQKANDSCICSVIGDIRDFERLKKVLRQGLK